MEETKVHMKENKDAGVIITTEDSNGPHFYHIIVNHTTDFNQKYKSGRRGLNGKVVIPSLLIAIVLSSGIYGVSKVVQEGKEYINDKDAKKLEEEKIKNNLSYIIDDADLTIVRAFLDEVLCDLDDVRNSNLATENVYKNMYNELLLAEKSDYAFHIKEGAKQASVANIYFGVGKYEKYLHAKNYNGVIYFPLEDALPSYSLEEISGDIVITYLPSDTTPYVSAADLEEFKKSREIENYMKSL